ncbi:MAG TPA: hypothetical protein VGQ93_07705 [Lysobacter sp.]|jgi:hypothetical protein|nr:hypothetical protein [Lysobacter sp.]
MASKSIGSFDQYSDEALMKLYFELSSAPEENASELAAIDAVIQARLFAAYGAAEPGSSPRIRYAA